MKKLIAVVAIVAFAALATGCAKNYTHEGVEYGSYGLINAGSNQNPELRYEPCWGNVFWGIILIETIIAPIYFFGFSLFHPVGLVTDPPGAVPRPN